ncbi:MAG: NAD-dependent epimerase/dehydratase family protein [Chitinophagaceae bacterium]|nr:NAD-dependent epimerase/dehydratase family protein [Chitinophagaceae bacterium]
MKSIFIIGSEGFIGKHLVCHYENKNFRVIKLDLIEKNEINYYKLNVNALNYKEIFQKYDFDFCINSSGFANVQLSFENPIKDFSSNVMNVYEILNCIKLFQPKCKFLNLSSAAVYGNPLKNPISEDSLINPTSPYGYHKYYSELICNEFYNLFNIGTISIRIFSAFGSGQKKLLFWDLYNKIKLSKEKIFLFGTGNESRDFIHVFDIVNAVDLILNNAPFNGDVYNVASGIEITIKKAVNLFLEIMNFKGDVIYTEDIKKGDPINWVANIEKLKKIGFINTYNLEDGLKEYKKWLKGNE